MNFAALDFLWIFLALPVVVLLYAWGHARRKRLMRRFADLGMLEKITTGKPGSHTLLRILFMGGAVFFLGLAILRPQWGQKMEILKRQGLDIMLVQDISLSMYARDISPDRLTRSKHEISDFLTRIHGDRVGLVAFAGEAQLVCPLTLDFSALRMFLGAIEPKHLLPGTNLAAGLRKAMDAFGEGDRKYQVVVLLTDGEEHEADVLKAAAEAAERGISVYAVGIGSLQGVPIPVGRSQKAKYKKDRRGNLVTTRLDEKTLKKIVTLTGGTYYHAGPGQFELQKFLEEIRDRERREVEGENYERYQERYQWPLSLALFFLLMESFLPDRRRKKGSWKGRFA